MVRVAVIDDYHRAFAGTGAIGRLRELADVAIYDKSFSSQDVMRTSNIVSIHLPLSDLSRGLVSRERIGLMKPTACLVNTARAAITDELAVPASRIKTGIAETLQREGFIWDYELVEQLPQNMLKIHLKYGPNGERVVQTIERTSKPGRRVYVGVKDMPDVLQGLGISILSTNQGVMSNREARKARVGGEVLCTIW